MRFYLIHVHDEDWGPNEEAVMVIPGAANLALAGPLDAAGHVVRAVSQAAPDLPSAVCGACGSELPGR